MKRLVQVWMVAVALLVGAQAAQAAPIADFSWVEDELDPFLVTFRLTNVSGGGEINSVAAKVTLFSDGTTFIDAEMVPSTILDPDGTTFLDDETAFNLALFELNTVQFVYLTFNYVGTDQVVRRFSEKFDAVNLVEVSAIPIFRILDPSFIIDSSPVSYTHLTLPTSDLV